MSADETAHNQASLSPTVDRKTKPETMSAANDAQPMVSRRDGGLSVVGGSFLSICHSSRVSTTWIEAALGDIREIHQDTKVVGGKEIAGLAVKHLISFDHGAGADENAV